MHKRVAAVLAAAAALAWAAPAGPATPAEQASFLDWYGRTWRATTHDAPHAVPEGLPRPRFDVVHDKGRRRVSATVDGAARRAALPLCSQSRAVFGHDPRAPKAQRWRPSGPPQTLVWIPRGSQCDARPDLPVRLLQPLPEGTVLALLRQHQGLLGGARLLMAGNTSCAPSRSRAYRLAGLDRNYDGLPVLVYESDIGGEARVAVRQARNELLPWAVACTGTR